MKLSVGILISGSGSNMVELVKSMDDEHPAFASVVISNNSDALGIKKARDLGVPTEIIDPRFVKKNGLDFETVVDQSTGYSKGSIWINDVNPEEKILVVDDVISTGGTMEAVLSSLEARGAILSEVWTIFEKGEGMKNLINKHNWPLKSLVRIEMNGAEVNIL